MCVNNCVEMENRLLIILKVKCFIFGLKLAMKKLNKIIVKKTKKTTQLLCNVHYLHTRIQSPPPPPPPKKDQAIVYNNMF